MQVKICSLKYKIQGACNSIEGNYEDKKTTYVAIIFCFCFYNNKVFLLNQGEVSEIEDDDIVITVDVNLFVMNENVIKPFRNVIIVITNLIYIN